MKRIVFVSFALAMLAIVPVLNTTPAKSTEDEATMTRIQRGFQIAPVHLDTQGKNRALIGLGSYFVNAVSECNDCHTCPTYAPGQNPFDGIGDGSLNAENYLAGGVNFGPGPDGEDIVSANLTPDEGKPAGLTFQEFKTLIRTGHDPDDEPGSVLQVMPWAFFRHMTDHDLRAIYEYLRSIPHAEPGTCAFPGQ